MASETLIAQMEQERDSHRAQADAIENAINVMRGSGMTGDASNTSGGGSRSSGRGRGGRRAGAGRPRGSGRGPGRPRGSGRQANA